MDTESEAMMSDEITYKTQATADLKSLRNSMTKLRHRLQALQDEITDLKWTVSGVLGTIEAMRIDLQEDWDG